MKTLLSSAVIVAVLQIASFAQAPAPQVEGKEVLKNDDVVFHQIDEHTWVGSGHMMASESLYLVEGSKKAVLIDAGTKITDLNSGVQPSEASGLLAHLAIYCGWPSAVSALDVYDQVYTARKVDTAALRATGPRLAVPASDSARANAVTEEFGAVAPKFAQLTNGVVFDDLWRRPDLNPRDRSLVTIAALAATGDDDQLGFYVRRGLESGLTRTEIIEAVTHMGFCAGWSKATRAMTVIAASALMKEPRS